MIIFFRRSKIKGEQSQFSLLPSVKRTRRNKLEIVVHRERKQGRSKLAPRRESRSIRSPLYLRTPFLSPFAWPSRKLALSHVPIYSKCTATRVSLPIELARIPSRKPEISILHPRGNVTNSRHSRQERKEENFSLLCSPFRRQRNNIRLNWRKLMFVERYRKQLFSKFLTF